jgi:2,4-didehydro-3-deoxy-L-rhamnonate hydrolase
VSGRASPIGAPARCNAVTGSRSRRRPTSRQSTSAATAPFAQSCLDDKIAVVTGASSGLRVAFAKGLAEAGTEIALGGRRVDRLDDTQTLVEAAGRTAIAVRTDVTHPQDCQALADAAVAWFGWIGILVNNAGVGTAVPALRDTAILRILTGRLGHHAELAAALGLLASDATAISPAPQCRSKAGCSPPKTAIAPGSQCPGPPPRYRWGRQGEAPGHRRDPPNHFEGAPVRIGNLSSRLTIFTEHGAVDVEKASAGRFAPDPQAVYDVWEDFLGWAKDADLSSASAFDATDLGSPTPRPAQLFGIGLNYRDHAAESKLAAPEKFPAVFTKFRTAISGPVTTVTLPEGGHTDWEVELVVVIGRSAERVSAADAWSYVAGLTVGQDISERIRQTEGAAPQFSVGKSLPGFAPIGPWLVTVDEFDNPDDLELGCAIDGESVQHSRTSNLIFPVPLLIERLSATLPLLPGDVIFTGTPAGVGLGRNPQRWLQPGAELVSYVTGIGELRQRFVSA